MSTTIVERYQAARAAAKQARDELDTACNHMRDAYEECCQQLMADAKERLLANGNMKDVVLDIVIKQEQPLAMHFKDGTVVHRESCVDWRITVDDETYPIDWCMIESIGNAALEVFDHKNEKVCKKANEHLRHIRYFAAHHDELYGFRIAAACDALLNRYD